MTRSNASEKSGKTRSVWPLLLITSANILLLSPLRLCMNAAVELEREQRRVRFLLFSRRCLHTFTRARLRVNNEVVINEISGKQRGQMTKLNLAGAALKKNPADPWNDCYRGRLLVGLEKTRFLKRHYKCLLPQKERKARPKRPL